MPHSIAHSMSLMRLDFGQVVAVVLLFVVFICEVFSAAIMLVRKMHR